MDVSEASVKNLSGAVAVIGLGYVGLPLALEFGAVGVEVTALFAVAALAHALVPVLVPVGVDLGPFALCRTQKRFRHDSRLAARSRLSDSFPLDAYTHAPHGATEAARPLR